MKNLKQVLALGMAFSLTMSAMAGAAFTDSADIKATEAVDMLSALGVINGYEDGSFKPDATVTRAEAAKMIYTIRNGGNSDASAWAGTATSFKDLNGYGWAEGYIKYCQSMGIIAGKSATQFDPGAPVTGTELAKMMLVTLGYNAETAGLTGAAWANKTLALASENGLLDDVASNLAAGLPRQYAAQLMYNAVLAPTVVLRDGQYTNLKLVTGIVGQSDYNETIGEKYMGLKDVEGLLYDVTYNADKKEYTYKVASDVNKDSTVEDNSFTTSGNEFVDLYMQNVKVLYKNENGKTVTYGLASNGSKVLASDVMGNIDGFGSINTDTKIKISGTEYELDVANEGALKVNSYMNATSADAAYKQTGGTELKSYDDTQSNETYSFDLIDRDGNGKADYIVVYPTVAAKVTYVGNDSFNISTSVDGTSSFNKKDVAFYDGIAKDDYVLVTAKDNTAENKTTFVKAETVSGKVDAVKNTEVRIGNVWYKKATSQVTGSQNIALNDTVTLVVANGYYVSAKITDTATTELLYVSANGDYDSLTKTFRANVTFTDGSNSTISVSKLDGSTPSAVTADSKDSALYTYSKLSDNTYELTSVSGTNTAGFDGFASFSGDKLNEADDKLNDVKIADDAVLFVEYKDGNVAVVTGKAVNGWKAATTSAGATLIDVNAGIQTVKSGFMIISGNLPGVSSSDTYGYIVDASIYETSEDGTKYVNYTVWNGSELVEVKEAGTTLAARPVGSFVKYNLTDKNEATNVSVYATSGSAADGVTPINGAVLDITGDNVTIKNASSTVVKKNADTKVIYFNSKDHVKADGTEIQLATESATPGQYDYNVVALYDAADDNKLLAMFVDVNNKLADTTTSATIDNAGQADTRVTITGAESVAETTNYKEIKVTIDGVPAAGNDKVKPGSTVTVTAKGKATGSQSLQIKIDTGVVATINPAKDAVVVDNAYTVTFKVLTGGALTAVEA